MKCQRVSVQGPDVLWQRIKVWGLHPLHHVFTQTGFDPVCQTYWSHTIFSIHLHNTDVRATSLKTLMSFACTLSKIRITVDSFHLLGTQGRIHVYLFKPFLFLHESDLSWTYIRVSETISLPSVILYSVTDCLGITHDLMNTEDGLINAGAFTRRC